ncbi:GLPGLI family protein [Carboxylicivirga sp. N1Y90]|uniref:GLPGLI family protein n=1 Tax=Carboxylicivirga fragile TaxID=3417571 RepID=UPI003D357D0E|nr:GLPGLI family protein [Marinilabiliaceae bacterium N1Y90]
MITSLKIINLFFVLTIISFSGYSQEITPIDTIKYDIEYRYTFLQDSNNTLSIKEQIMALEIGGRVSKYKSKNGLTDDSILFVNRNKSFGEIMQIIKPQLSKSHTSHFCNYTIYKKYPKKQQLLFTGPISPKQWMSFIEELDFKWALSSLPETLVLGYKCKTAYLVYGGRKFIAHYTLDIPISEGPYKFCGLPGLILKIHDEDELHCFEAIGIKKLNEVKPILLTKKDYIAGSQKDYILGKKARTEELLRTFIYQQGSSYSEETKAKAVHNLKSRNNYIERF